MHGTPFRFHPPLRVVLCPLCPRSPSLAVAAQHLATPSTTVLSSPHVFLGFDGIYGLVSDSPRLSRSTPLSHSFSPPPPLLYPRAYTTASVHATMTTSTTRSTARAGSTWSTTRIGRDDRCEHPPAYIYIYIYIACGWSFFYRTVNRPSFDVISEIFLGRVASVLGR